MTSRLLVAATLTDRYQTIIPELVRELPYFQSFNQTLIERAQYLTKGVDVDFDTPLDENDE